MIAKASQDTKEKLNLKLKMQKFFKKKTIFFTIFFKGFFCCCCCWRITVKKYKKKVCK